MSKDSISTVQNKVYPKSMDFDSLRKEAIKYTQELSGENWTDYNFHDPGVTILEQFCYAITDIAYRTNLSIENLLFHSGKESEILESNALFPPDKIYPCSPITPDDYKVWVLDHFPDLLSNAWVVPVLSHQDGISGLYSINIIFRNKLSDARQAEVLEQINIKLSTIRNLGEDFDQVEALLSEKLSFSTEIDLTQDASGEEVLAEILYQVERYINPTIDFLSLSEMRDRGFSLEEIYDTPSCQHGFIIKSQLIPRQFEFHVSKIADFITRIKGVRDLKSFQVLQDGVPIYGDSINLPKGKYFTLAISQEEDPLVGFDIKLFKGGVVNRYTVPAVMYSLDLKEAQSQKNFEIKKEVKSDSFRRSSTKELSKYLSIQASFPGIYKVGSYTPHQRESRQKVVESKQLQGYLLFFDQLLANHLEQLIHIHKLFSIDEKDLSLPTNYTQLLQGNVTGADELLVGLDQLSLNKLTNNSSNNKVRKDKVLSHLLARFGEKFTTDFHLKFNQLAEGLSTEDVNQRLVELKATFLRDIQYLNRYRSLGYDYRGVTYEASAPLSLKKKICLLLDIKNIENKKLASVELADKLKKEKISSSSLDQKRVGEDRFYDQEIKEGTIKFIVNSKSIVEYLFRFGLDAKNYHLVTEGHKVHLLFSTPNKDQKVKIAEFTSRSVALDTLKKLIEFLKGLNDDSEGFHIVEHILFRSFEEKMSFYYLKNSKDEKIFKSLENGTHSKQKVKGKDAALLACYSLNYEILENKEAEYTVFIKNSVGKRFVKSVKNFTTEQVAQQFVEECLELFNEQKEQELLADLIEVGSQKQYSFKVQSLEYTTLLVSCEDNRLTAQEHKVAEVGILGKKATNYEIVSLSVNQFRVVLKDYQGDTIAQSPDVFASSNVAETHINECITLCEHYQRKGSLKNAALYLTNQSYDANLYNMKVSIVFPNWTSRFQNQEFLQIFSKTIFNCAPAHLGINFIGLSYTKMKNFETKYFYYLEKLKNGDSEDYHSLFKLGEELLGSLSASSLSLNKAD